MGERRKHVRLGADYKIRLQHPDVGMVMGQVANMSEGGVFVSQLPSADFSLGVNVEAQIIGDGWDEGMQSLTMRVVWIGRSGVALVYTGTPFMVPELEVSSASCNRSGE